MPRTAYCFDLDATVTVAEILPAIAQAAGLGADMAAMTRAAMAGEVGFVPSLRARCKMLEHLPLNAIQSVIGAVGLDPHIVQFITAHAQDCHIVTANLDVWIAPLMRQLPCHWHSSRARYQGGRLLLDHVIDKGQAAAQIRAQGYGRLIAIGDGANDIPMFRVADHAIAFGGVHRPAPPVLAAAHHFAPDGAALVAHLEGLR